MEHREGIEPSSFRSKRKALIRWTTDANLWNSAAGLNCDSKFRKFVPYPLDERSITWLLNILAYVIYFLLYILHICICDNRTQP